MSFIKQSCHGIIHESVLLGVIFISTLAMFFDAFPTLHAVYSTPLAIIIYLSMLYFLIQVSIKMYIDGTRPFFSKVWNQFDFVLVLASLPLIFQPSLAAGTTGFLLLRVGRLMLLFKLLRFIPHGERIWHGMKNALKASVGVIFALLLLNFLFAMGATYLFAEIAPQYFGDPISSMYAMFKVFTVEGWFEIPDAIAQTHPDGMVVTLVKSYFIFAVLFGGILGLSLANAIFIDEMTMDNTDTIEEEILILRQQQAEQTALLLEIKSELHLLQQAKDP
ncbi:MAG: ion transporter [Methylococcales bacterium]|jgi:voltage-gated sodium channel|nr:ion transporter [Methylococcales bacterium]MBT7445925.1 ion transporter [Methylococcales bacterium]